MKKSSSELKRMARETLNGKYGISIVFMIMNSFIPFVLLLPFSLRVNQTSPGSQWAIYYLASLIVNMITIILSCGLISFHLRIARGEAYQFSDILAGFRTHPQKIVGAYLLLYLIMIPPAIPGAALLILSLTIFPDSAPLMGLGIIALIIGIVIEIILVLQYSLIFYLFMDDPEYKVMDLFRESKRLMTDNKFRLFYLGLSFIGWYLLGIISCGIGFLWVMPYMSQAHAQFYLDVLDEKNTVHPKPEEPEDCQYDSQY